MYQPMTSRSIKVTYSQHLNSAVPHPVSDRLKKDIHRIENYLIPYRYSAPIRHAISDDVAHFLEQHAGQTANYAALIKMVLSE